MARVWAFVGMRTRVAVSSVADSRKTRQNAAASPGPMRGSVTRQNTVRRGTPSEWPTSSSPTGDLATAARTDTTASGKNITA